MTEISDGVRHTPALASAEGHAAIPGWPGYFASIDGRIFSATGWRGESYRELEQHLNTYGYPAVRLTPPEGKRTRRTVHRLMALAYLPAQPSPEHEVRHLDGNPLNRAAENLAWGTRAENAADRERHGRTSRGRSHSEAILAGIRQSPIAREKHGW